MKLPTVVSYLALALLTLLPALAQSPSKPVPGKPEPVPPFLQGNPPAPEPTTPPPRPFHNSRYGASFTIPPPWNIHRKDADVTPFSLNAPHSAHTPHLPPAAPISSLPPP